jgi:hypothetical protein
MSVGSELVRGCAAGGSENRDGHRFCRSCGASLTPVVERRKLVTSVFCDLSGSAALGGQVDPQLVFEGARALTRVSPLRQGFG